MRIAWMVLLALAGCGDDTTSLDMATDLAVVTPDLSMHDLLPVVDVDSGMCAPSGMTHAKVVVNALFVPMSRSDYAMDLNGDGKTDNQLGNVLGALAAQNLDVQAATNASLAAGEDIMLLDVASGDAAFDTDPCAATTFYNGVNQASPDFSGGGSFGIDSAVAPTFFSGPINAARFSSAPPPSMQTVPEQLHIKLPLFGLVPVTLWGAHIQWKYAAGGLMQGQINGAMTQSDVQHVVIPNVAALYNQRLQADPSSSTSQQIKAIFDTGGNADPTFGSCAAGTTCKGVDGQCGVANDGIIQVCEVATNSIIKNVLAPDVQMFQNGSFKPTAANTMKDSLSVGLGFTAVAGSF